MAGHGLHKVFTPIPAYLPPAGGALQSALRVSASAGLPGPDSTCPAGGFGHQTIALMDTRGDTIWGLGDDGVALSDGCQVDSETVESVRRAWDLCTVGPVCRKKVQQTRLHCLL